MSTEDPFFGEPFVDTDEWREEPQRHRYVHGGFEGTDTRFSIYFPPEAQYRGRFFQVLAGGWAGDENGAVSPIAGNTAGGFEVAFRLGGFLVESNQGHFMGDFSGLCGDVSIMDYRASAETARFARGLARDMYGTVPHHGYVYGGSAGGHRSIRCLESAPELYDGAVPYMMLLGSLGATVNTARYWAAYVLRERIESIIDAADPGGSGNPFEGLDSDEREALAYLYQTGYPRGAEFLIPSITPAPVMLSLGKQQDPGYFDDFWREPGYLGADRPDVFAKWLVEEKGVVTGVATAAEVGLVMAGFPPDTIVGLTVDGIDKSRLLCAERVVLTSGAAEGTEFFSAGLAGDIILGSGWLTGSAGALNSVKPGDEVVIDNRDFLAFCHVDRHNVDLRRPTYPQWIVDGLPVFPQRSELMNHTFINERHSGKFAGKMVLLQHEMDGISVANPVAAHDDATLVKEHLGDAIDKQFRLWYTANAHHVPGSFVSAFESLPYTHTAEPTTRVIEFGGTIEHALFHLVEWVENGTPPPASTSYQMTNDQRLVLAERAEDRLGIQPVVRATVNANARGDVTTGATVEFEVVAEVPPGAGTIAGVDWDFEGNGTWPYTDANLGRDVTRVRLSTTYRYPSPGTYFASVRVHAVRDASLDPRFAVTNLARVRVVVS